MVTLDGSRSIAATGTIKRFEWLAGNKPVATGANATVRLPVGQHTLTRAATDDAGAVGYGGVRITILPEVDPVPPRDRLALWLKADGVAGLVDGAPVVTWPDASGNGLDPFQTDATKQPVWRMNAVNGLPAIHFDGIDDNLETRYYRDLLFASANASVYVVFRSSGPPDNRGLVSSNWTALATTRDQGGGLVYTTAYALPDGKTAWKNVNPGQPGGVAENGWTMGAVVRSGEPSGRVQLFVNRQQNDDGTAVPYHATNAKNGYIGCLRGESGCWKGDIAEILIYGAALAEKDHESVQRYLAHKYGLNSAR